MVLPLLILLQLEVKLSIEIVDIKLMLRRLYLLLLHQRLSLSQLPKALVVIFFIEAAYGLLFILFDLLHQQHMIA